jgi:hypothetical protein
MAKLLNLNSLIEETRKEILYSIPALRPRKILFNHIPKCGGTSITAYLALHFPKRKMYIINGREPKLSIKKFKKFSKQKRYSYDIIAGHGSHELLDYVHPESFKITVFRDPAERIISLYYYIKRCEDHPLHSITKHYEIQQWLKMKVVKDRVSNFYIKYFLGKSPNELINPIEDAVSAIKLSYDSVGIIENMNKFIKIVQHEAFFKI